jgi:outer membrane protein assembly factor BamD
MKTLRRSPGETIFNQTLNRIYTIGLAFLHGRAKRSFLGVSYWSPTHGVEVLLGEKGLLTRFPLQRYSSAVWEIAEYYFNKSQYSEAEKVYEQLVRQFPESEWAEQAEYKLAVSVYNQVRGVEYDQEPLKRARRRFGTYRARFPRGNYNEKVREYLREIAEIEAQHDLTVAKYYLRESRPRAARFYLRSVLLNNPKTDAAREARPMWEQLSDYTSDERPGLGGSGDDQGK